MNGGRLVQLGPPRELYDRPADAFVADFIGEMNLLPGTMEGVGHGAWTVRTAAGIAAATPSQHGIGPGSPVRLAIRPEHVELVQGGSPPDDAESLRGRVMQCVFNGASTAVQVELDGGAILRVDVGARSDLASLRPGTPVLASWPTGNAIAFRDLDGTPG